MPAHRERYVDEDYPRGTRRERDGRDVRETREVRERERERDREPREVIRDNPRNPRITAMEVEPPRMANRIIEREREPELLRNDQQRIANSGVPRQQQDPRAIRNVINPRELRDRDDDMMYDAPRQAQYANLREDRDPARRTPYDNEFDDIPAPVRPTIIDPAGGRARGDVKPKYNEYFLPGDGIDREVIQSELCRYLGQDATMKTGEHHDGRKGYIIRAYRALTTEMIRSLKEDSVKYSRERDSARSRNKRPVTYAEYRDQDRYGNDDVMMIDEPDERDYHRQPQPRYVEEPRLRAAGTSGYMPEPGYPAYYPTTSQPPPPGVDMRLSDPRYIPGNATPPGVRPGYAAPGYAPVVTRAPAAAIPAGGAGYTDPRTGARIDPGYAAYPTERAARHR